MKFFYSLIIVLAFCSLANGQSIPNANFESWSIINAPDDPVSYQSTNFVSFATFFSAADSTSYRTKDHISGKYGLQLVTRANSVDTVPGSVFTGTLGGTINNVKLLGGLPFTGKPDSLEGYYKSDMHAGDSGYIILLFKKNGVPFSLDSFSLSGSVNTYTHFQVALKPLITSPDSIFIVITSGTPHHTQGSDTLTVDSLYFNYPIAASSTPPFSNGNFENWKTTSLGSPTGWNTPNLATIFAGTPSVSQSTDAFSGQYAMQIQTVLTDNKTDKIGYSTIGSVVINTDTTFPGGFAYDSIPLKFIGYYKYTPVGADTAGVEIIFRKSGKVIGVFPYKLPPTSVYTQFIVPINLTKTPDSANILFVSSNFLKAGNYVGLGSALLVDDISFITKPTQFIVAPDTLSFHTIVEDSASAELHFLLKGSELFPYEDTVIITAPKGFEISQTSGSGFAQTLKLSYTNDILPDISIYVHFRPYSIRDYRGDISIIGGAPAALIFVNGKGIAPAPIQQSSINFKNITTSSITVQLTGGSGKKRLLLINQSKTVNSFPVDTVAYRADSVFPFSGANQLSTGNYVVLEDTSHSVTITGLSPSHIYYFESFDYNDNDTVGGEDYDKTNPSKAVAFTTGKNTAPTTQSIISFYSVSNTSISVSLSGGNGQKRLLLVNDSTAVDDTPANYVSYTANAVFPFTGASEIGKGNYVVLLDTFHSVTLTGLTPNHRYYFASFDYNDNGKSDSEMFDTRKPGIADTITSLTTYIQSGLSRQILDIYPNPATGIVYIAMPQGIVKDIILLVSGIDGKLLSSQIIKPSGDKYIQMDMANYSQGVYIITLKDNSGIWVGKLIKE